MSLYIDKFCRYLKAIRFLPKPIDTSVTSFFVSQENYIKYQDQFDALSKRMILINNQDRKGKNKKGHAFKRKFKINFVYSEKYQLPLISRGTIEIGESILKVVFNGNDRKFDRILSSQQRKWSNLDNKTPDMFSEGE